MSWGLWLYANENRGGEPVEAWLETYDPEAYDGRGSVTATTDPARAKRFETIDAALEEWRRQSVVRPRRPDGKPNRPLTAFTAAPRVLPES